MSINRTVASVFEADLPVLKYELTATPADAWPEFERAQRQAPIAIGPVGVEVLSYDFARAVLRDTRFVIPPGINLAAQGITSGALYDKVMETLLCLEGAEHQRLRRLVSKAFTPRATARLHDTIHDFVNGLIDQVADAGRCDVVPDIAVPYPIAIICALLGAPREDWKLFSAWTGDVSKAFMFTVDLAEVEPIVMRAWGELDDYVDAMIDRRRHNLTEDLVSDLVRAEDDGDRLTSEELKTLAASLLMAGTDTTRNQLAASVQVLCEHPEQWALLHDHPELAMGAVEESIRHSPAVCGAPRMASGDVEFGGFLFPSGTILQINTFAANRDPHVYDHADRLDIRRDDAPAILTFGGGVHYCLGANLARVELAEALTILAHRLPTARRAGPAPWKPLLGLSGPTSLPIEFETDCAATASP